MRLYLEDLLHCIPGPETSSWQNPLTIFSQVTTEPPVLQKVYLLGYLRDPSDLQQFLLAGVC